MQPTSLSLLLDLMFIYSSILLLIYLHDAAMEEPFAVVNEGKCSLGALDTPTLGP